MAFMSDVERYQRSVGRIAAHITRSVRDTDLTPEQAAQYRPGMILFARGRTEASMWAGEPQGTHRFLILSDHMLLRKSLAGTDEAWIAVAGNARFKVLDVYERDGKTQILLLHLPDREEWKLYREFSGEAEQKLAAEGRKHFDRALETKLAPAREAPEWRRRSAAPVGLDEAGIPQDPEPEGEDALYPVEQAGFRDFFHRFIYLDRDGAVESWAGKLLEKEDTGVIAYGYFDDRRGLTFRLLAAAALNGRSVVPSRRLDDTSTNIRRQDLTRERYLPLSPDQPEMEQFREREGVIRSWFDTRDASLAKLRDMEELDEWRTPNYPDNVQAFLFKPGFIPEQVWVKPNSVIGGRISGELLSEPKGGFGVHMGSVVPIRIFEKADGSWCLFSFIGAKERDETEDWTGPEEI